MQETLAFANSVHLPTWLQVTLAVAAAGFIIGAIVGMITSGR